MAATAVDIKEALRSLSLKDLRVQCRARGLSPAGGMEALTQRVTDSMAQTGNLTIYAEQAQEQGGVDSNGLSANNYSRPGGNQNLGNKLTSRPTSRVLNPPGGVSSVFFGDSSPAPSKPAPAPIASPTPATKAAEEVLARMGLGNTDELVNGSVHATPEKPRNNSAGAEAMPAVSLAQVDEAIRPLTLKELRVQCRARGLSPAGGQEQLRQRLGQSMLDTNDTRILEEGASLDTPAAAPQAVPQGTPTSYATNNYNRPNGMQNVGNFITDRPSSRVLAPPGGRSQISFG